MSLNSHLPRITAYLFVTLQAVLVWQGNRMVASIDKLTEAATQTQITIARQDDRIREMEKDQLELTKNTGSAIQSLSNETRDLDRRVNSLASKLESIQ
ncbi:hypothetical protein ACET8O_20350 [Aeromonas veronii]